MTSSRCERCRELVSLGLDEPLAELPRLLVERHLAACEACRRFAGEVTAATRSLRAAPLLEPARPLTLELPRRLERRFATAAVGAAAAAAAAAAFVLAPGALTGGASSEHAVSRADVAAVDLASMRLSRRQQLRPVASRLDQLRVRVLEID
jgi:predicted anti-sigma-YlaC factor YlaD